MNSRIKNLPSILWKHKKKSAIALISFVYGLKTLDSQIKNEQRRRFYAEKAKTFGMEPIAPNGKVRRVTVLINREANRRKAAQLFNKNALPLLNLAGLEVNVVQVNSQTEMEQISLAIDSKEADCLFIVGGDGTVCRVLTGMCQRGENASIMPIGIFPGGRRNKSFALLDFIRTNADPDNKVRLCCESAMAMIHGQKRIFHPIKCTIAPLIRAENIESLPNNSTSIPVEQQFVQSVITENKVHDQSAPEANSAINTQTHWLLSELAAGWFEYCKQRESKFWWMGSLKSWFIYPWEFLKAYPAHFRLELTYDEYCPGCRKCIKLPKIERNNNNGGIIGWLYWLIGVGDTSVGKVIIDPKLAEFTKRENPRCGIPHKITVHGNDIRLEAQQDEDGNNTKLRLHIFAIPSRFSAIKEGWRRITLDNTKAASVSSSVQEFPSSTKEEAYNKNEESLAKPKSTVGTEIEAGSIRMHFTHMPEKIQKIAVSGDWLDFEDYANKEVIVEGTRQAIPIYVPYTEK